MTSEEPLFHQTLQDVVLDVVRILVGQSARAAPRLAHFADVHEDGGPEQTSLLSLKTFLDKIAREYASRSPGLADRTDEDAVAASFKDDYVYFQYHLVEFFTEHLLDLSRVFDGDLQQVVILAVIGQMVLHGAMRSAHGAPNPALGISASRIADVAGIPRQTVRRKLDALSERGWIKQDAQAGWHLVVKDGTAVVATDLAKLDARGIARGARLAAAFARRL